MRSLVLVIVLSLIGLGCKNETAETGAKSYLSGKITVSTALDSTGQFDGFEVMVAQASPTGGIDTLGIGETDSLGVFSMNVVAKDRGLYSLLVTRYNQPVAQGEIVIANRDSATLNISLPAGSKPIIPRSMENGAWMAWKNTKATYQNDLQRSVQAGTTDLALEQSVMLAINILEGIPSQFPNTLGAQMARAEAVLMLEGWDDSLLVEKAKSISGNNPQIPVVASVARRAAARIGTTEDAIALLSQYQNGTQDRGYLASLGAEKVQSYIDANNSTKALSMLKEFRASKPDSIWLNWADRTEYIAQNLLKGMPAPTMAINNLDGETIDLADYKGKLVMLEFWSPWDEGYAVYLPQLVELQDRLGADKFQIIGICMGANESLRRDVMQGRQFPGIQLMGEEDFQGPLATSYNIQQYPFRVLLDKEGNIIARYGRDGLVRMAEDIVEAIGGLS